MKRIILLILLLIGTSTFFVKAEEMPEMISRFQSDKYALMRKYTVRESAEYYQRFSKFYADWSEVVKTVSFDQLSQESRVDYILFKNQIEKELYFLKIKQKEFEEVAHVADFASPLYSFIKERRRGAKVLTP